VFCYVISGFYVISLNHGIPYVISLNHGIPYVISLNHGVPYVISLNHGIPYVISLNHGIPYVISLNHGIPYVISHLGDKISIRNPCLHAFPMLSPSCSTIFLCYLPFGQLFSYVLQLGDNIGKACKHGFLIEILSPKWEIT